MLDLSPPLTQTCSGGWQSDCRAWQAGLPGCRSVGMRGCWAVPGNTKSGRQFIEGAGLTREVEVWAEGRGVDTPGYKRPIKGRRCHSAGSGRRGPRSADMKTLVVILAVVAACKAAPQFAQPPQALLEFGVDDHGCTVAATGVVCPWGPVQFLGEAKGVDKPWFPPPTQRPFQQHHSVQQHHQTAFTGLVGPSGVIGPSGLVGPSGPVAFGR
ncbi:uncharacterized protein LOC123505799 isoform X1 [Portunus trituberculatus]|uniref:uncharacterized protein LOC123505799 isoform X1 n=2 Tax=Portunus trituberculatus TaxID=210409 RepID=UPI001E1CC8A9|nr:uncharacterized protein LOC123505799 isoform X1 [Portunus trituberculatus]